MSEEYFTGFSVHQAHETFTFLIGSRFCGRSETIAIGKLPDRESYCLYHEKQGRITPLAYFKTEQQAREAGELLELLARSSPLP